MAFAAERGWTMDMLAKGFSLYAACHLGALFAAGPLVDRLGAARFLPSALLPIITGLVLLSLFPAPIILYLYLGLVGATQGLSATASGAIWAERYGTLHLGAIRSMNQAIMVVSTAASPILVGFVLDRGAGVAVLGLGLAGAATLASRLVRMGTCIDGKRFVQR